jgi:hypothetical protein
MIYPLHLALPITFLHCVICNIQSVSLLHYDMPITFSVAHYIYRAAGAASLSLSLSLPITLCHMQHSTILQRHMLIEVKLNDEKY